MGVFTKSRKAKENEGERVGGNGETAGYLKMSRTMKRKGKNNVEPKPEFDLATALPDTNDFRTSLMLPGLSARFSMLREQDDPNTKVGKASDDSVLFPKRASRLYLFSHNPLTDIAEVESIHSIPKPFAREERSNSVCDGYQSDDGGSMMARSRPGEGNTLFGGRQKMYRIATGSGSGPGPGPGSGSGSGSGSALGKHVYEDDVSLSTYQQYRAKMREDEKRAEAEDRPESTPLDDQEESDAVHSPMTGFSKNRGTTSSTTSGPSNRRTSTAATSVTSESPAPRQDSGLGFRFRTSDLANGSDGNTLLHNSSADSRKNIFVKNGPSQPPLPSHAALRHQLSQSKSAVHLNEKYARSPVLPTTAAFRAVSPPLFSNPHALSSLDSGLQELNKASNLSARRYQASSPTNNSHIDDEIDNVYHSILQPNDRGKATAMGLFSRPQQQFDEQQFLQRQRQMHEGRSSPFAADATTGSGAQDTRSPAMHRIENGSPARANGSASGASQSQESPLASNTASPNSKSTRNMPGSKLDMPNYRPRNQSSASSTSAPGSTSVKTRAESLIRRQNAELVAMEDGMDVFGRGPPKASAPPEDTHHESEGTFFNIGSDEESDQLSSPRQLESRPRLASTDIHPALRDGTHDFDFGDDVTSPPNGRPRESNTSAFESNPSVDVSPMKNADRGGDSPTLGPNGLGLSGLIRTHLRHDSDKSSVYPPPSPGLPPSRTSRHVSMVSNHTINPPPSVHSDPWEFDNAHGGPLDQASHPAPTMSQKAQKILGHVAAHNHQMSSKAQKVLGNEAPNTSQESSSGRTWQQELAHTHTRGESTETTETTRERRDFDNELAERRRRVQAGLKASADDIRSRDPSGRQERHHGPPTMPVVGPRSRAFSSNGDRPNKAMRMLGLNGGTREDFSPLPPRSGMPSHFDHGQQERDPQWPPSQPRHPAYDPRIPGGRRTPANRPPPPSANSSYEDFDRARQRSATPNSGAGFVQDRANSAMGDRSKSRNGRYRDEEGYPRQGTTPSPPQVEARRRGPTPDDTRNGYERSPSAMSGRMRNGSRPPAPYFDGRGLPPPGPPPAKGVPVVNALPSLGAPRPSPRPPMSPLQQPAPSPGLNGPPGTGHPMISPQPPHPTNGRTTPIDSGRTTPNGTRKKSVTKHMISEPTFVSSTSSVPLVGLHSGVPNGTHPTQIDSPPLPAMNPRRHRGNTFSERPPLVGGSHSAQSSPSIGMISPLPPTSETFDSRPASPHLGGYEVNSMYGGGPAQYGGRPPPRARNRLRKISSEGGNMAARARQQALMVEMGREKDHSPMTPVFPNRSATSLGVAGHAMARNDGGMF